MFLAEIVAGVAAGSASLQADALDFLDNTANYAISRGVLGLWVLASTAWHAYASTLPEAGVMGVVGVAALVANGLVAIMLFCYRSGNANRRSGRICSRNDAVGNVAVLLAAAGIFGSSWPDLIVASIIAAPGIGGG